MKFIGKKEKETVSFYLTVEIVDALRSIAKKEKINKSMILDQLLRTCPEIKNEIAPADGQISRG